MPAKTETTNPLAAVPLIAAGVEARRDSATLVQLQRRVEPSRGLVGRITRALGYQRHARVNLDARGSYFWDCIDGKRTLAEIAVELEDRFELDPAEARHATVTFTRMLMLRHILQLKVER